MMHVWALEMLASAWMYKANDSVYYNIAAFVTVKNHGARHGTVTYGTLHSKS